MIFRRLFNFSPTTGAAAITRLISTKNRMKDSVRCELEAISKTPSHKLYPVAQKILRLYKDAEDVEALVCDPELESMARNDLNALEDEISVLKREFLTELVDSYRIDPVYQKCREIMLEVSPGVGGQEAMLFSKELLNMYTNYAEFKNWEVQVINFDTNELGGLRHGSILIQSPKAYKLLALESGVHRVQRVPKTEKAGRIHTSTSTVSILPTVDEVHVKLDDKDLKIETKRASGAGGQHVNTTDSAVRITHLPSGLSVDCQTERSQIRNRAIGLQMLRNKLYKLELDKSIKLSKDLKRMQIGFGERSDKIRTFNYPQDRITDHRYGFSVHGVGSFLTGAEYFDEFVEELRNREVDRVLEIL